MDHRLVYALTDEGLGPWRYVLAGLGTSLVAALCFGFWRRTPMMLASGIIKMRQGIFFGIWFSVVTMLILAFGFNAWSDYREVMRAVREGRERTLEGRVDAFEASGITNHKEVVLRVGDTSFFWRESTAGRYGYGAMPSAQSAVQVGERVRIHYVDQFFGPRDARITRLEIVR
jgi:hypothetical protein